MQQRSSVRRQVANSTIRIAFLAVVTDRTGGGFNDVPFTAVATINVVPEPSGSLALAGGISMIAALRRRKRSVTPKAARVRRLQFAGLVALLTLLRASLLGPRGPDGG